MVADLRSGRFDLLLTGYSDRWQRNLRRTLELLEDELHPNGVALVMCDRKILSSDPSDWDELISEAAGAEKYSRRLSERITEGYAAKFDQERDPGGHAALGFRRLPEPPHTLEIDPERMPIAVGLFERYALGNVSATQLEAETGLAATRISEDKMLVGRTFSYSDTQRYRVGPNYLQLPINQPLARPATNQRDGQMAYSVDVTGQNPSVNYEPNSTGGLREAERNGPDYEPEISGRLTRSKIERTNDFAQAGERFRTMPDWEREDLVANMVALLGQCERQIQDRTVGLFAQCNADYGARVADGLGIPSPMTAATA